MLLSSLSLFIMQIMSLVPSSQHTLLTSIQDAVGHQIRQKLIRLSTQILIQGIGDKTVTVMFPPTTFEHAIVMDLQFLIFAKTGISMKDQKLVHKGRLLLSNQLLSLHNIERGSFIRCNIICKGGSGDCDKDMIDATQVNEPDRATTSTAQPPVNQQTIVPHTMPTADTQLLYQLLLSDLDPREQ